MESRTPPMNASTCVSINSPSAGLRWLLLIPSIFNARPSSASHACPWPVHQKFHRSHIVVARLLPVQRLSIARPSLVHCSSIARPSLVHRPLITRPSFVQRPSIAQPLPVHRSSIARPSPVHRLFIARPSLVHRSSGHVCSRPLDIA